MRFKHVLALLGFAVMAAAYSEPGAYERLYFYYAYKLDSMIKGGPKIAEGCAKSRTCTFDEFLNYIEEGGRKDSVTTDEFPDVEATATKYQQIGKAGKVTEGRVMDGSKNYADLFERVKERLKFIQYSDNYQHPTLTGEELTTKVTDVKENLMQSLKQVWQGRARATLTSFKPYGGFKVKTTDGGKAVDFAATLNDEANKGAMTEAKLKELWTEYINGREPTEELVKGFKPLENWKIDDIVEKDGIVDIQNSVKGAFKKINWLEKGSKWFQKQWVTSFDAGHKDNIKNLKDTYESLEGEFCTKKARKRDARRLRKRQSLGCVGSAEIDELLTLKPESLETEGIEVNPEEGFIPANPEQVVRANFVSEQEFEAAAVERLGKIPNAWAERVKTNTFKDIRIKNLGYKPLEPTSPKLRSGGVGLAGAAGIAVGGAFYVKGLVDAFVNHVSPLNFFAALTSIVPFLGCAFDTAASVQDKVNTGFIVAEAVLCNVADALLLTPFAPVGVVLHIVQAVVKLFRPPPTPPTVEELTEKRDAAWAHSLEDVYRFMYSAYGNDKDRVFAYKMESALFFDGLNVLSEAADNIGALNATGSAELFDTKLFPNQQAVSAPAELETKSQEAIKKIQTERWAVISRRQRDYLLRIPTAMANGSAFSIGQAAVEVNENFIKYINSKEFKETYPNNGWQGEKVKSFFSNWAISISKHPEQVLSGILPGGLLSTLPIQSDPDFKYPDIYTFIDQRVKETSDALSSKPPALPRALDVAFILGQSKTMWNIPKDTLSPLSYFDVEVSQATKDTISTIYRQRAVVRHTRQVVDVLYGRMKEDQFDDSIFPVKDAELLKNFRLLIAMKLGAVHDFDRVQENHRRFGSSGYDPDLADPRKLTRLITPYIPIIKEHPRYPVPVSHYLSMVSGLSETLVDEALSDKITDYLKTESDELKKSWEALQKHQQNLKSTAEKIAAIRARPAAVPGEFLDKHRPTCVGKDQDEKKCKYIVEGCHYSENTSDEFVNDCIEAALSNEKTRAQKVELCAKFPSYQECELAIQACDNTHSNSMYSVLFDCAAKAAPDREAQYAAAAGETPPKSS